MRDPDVRTARYAARYDDHVAAINREVVDRLRRTAGREATPYVDPTTGGVDARLLFLGIDPGPKAAGGTNASGMLSWDNDDDTAAMCARHFELSGIPWSAAMPWNVVPWPTPSLRSIDFAHGRATLAELLGVLPNVVIIMTLGITVHRQWQLVLATGGKSKLIQEVRTPHPSKRGLTFDVDGNRQSRAAGERQLREAFVRIAEMLGAQP